MSDNHDHSGSTPKTIWRTFWILLAITILEISYALVIGPHVPKLANNALYICMTLIKAFFIIAEFMHMKYEVKSLILTAGLPCMLLIWLVLANTMDGNSWRKMMNKPIPEVVKHAMEHPESLKQETHNGGGTEHH
jgi:cytochrome c oxidase subunit IV